MVTQRLVPGWDCEVGASTELQKDALVDGPATRDLLEMIEALEGCVDSGSELEFAGWKAAHHPSLDEIVEFTAPRDDGQQICQRSLDQPFH
jgi:hypothetical protein